MMFGSIALPSGQKLQRRAGQVRAVSMNRMCFGQQWMPFNPQGRHLFRVTTANKRIFTAVMHVVTLIQFVANKTQHLQFKFKLFMHTYCFSNFSGLG